MKEYPTLQESPLINPDRNNWRAVYMQGVQEMAARCVEPAIISPNLHRDQFGNPVAVWVRNNSFHASIYPGSHMSESQFLQHVPIVEHGWDEHAQSIGQKEPYTAQYNNGQASLRFRLYVARANPEIARPYRYAIEGEETEGNEGSDVRIHTVTELSEWQYAMGMDIADTEAIAWKLQEMKIPYDRYPVSQDLSSGGYNGWKAWGGNFK